MRSMFRHWHPGQEHGDCGPRASFSNYLESYRANLKARREALPSSAVCDAAERVYVDSGVEALGSPEPSVERRWLQRLVYTIPALLAEDHYKEEYAKAYEHSLRTRDSK